MPKKSKGKARTKAKKSAFKKPVKKKRLKKKVIMKKAAKKKIAKKKTAKKKIVKKKAAGKKAIKKAVKKKAPAKPPMVAPGPQPTGIPPVEEPATHEGAVGTVTHYYSHLGVAVVQVNKGTLTAGDTVRIKGHTTDFTQTVESMEYEHQHIDQASAGQSVGIKVKDHVREHDIVYIVK